MKSDFVWSFNGRYIHLVHSPNYQITPTGMDTLWQQLSRACKTYDCLKVFAEGPQPKRHMGTMDALESGNQASQIPGLSMAIYFPKYKTDETTEFFMNVAHNRGARVQFFTDRKKAFKWLGVEEDTPPDAKPSRSK